MNEGINRIPKEMEKYHVADRFERSSLLNFKVDGLVVVYENRYIALEVSSIGSE